MSATDPRAGWLADQPSYLIANHIQRHERLLRHGKATPASIARHQASIAEARAEIERRGSVRLEAYSILDLLLGSFAPRPGRRLHLVTATRGPNRVPQANPPMQGHYDLMRRAIRLVK